MAKKRAVLKSKYDKRQEGDLHTQVSMKLKKVDVGGKLEVIVEGKEPEIGVSMLLSSEQAKLGAGTNGLNPTRVYLDNCSTFMQMVNPDLLCDVTKGDTYLYSFCNAGTTATNVRGVFGDTAPIKDIESWLNQRGIANILSMPELKKAWCPHLL